MAKADLVQDLVVKTGQSKVAVDAVLRELPGVLLSLLQSEGKITLPGIGTFKKKERKARQGTNPGTGEKINIPASTVVSVTLSAGFKKGV